MVVKKIESSGLYPIGTTFLDKFGDKRTVMVVDKKTGIYTLLREYNPEVDDKLSRPEHTQMLEKHITRFINLDRWERI